jgi:CHAT domain-containing protein
VRPTGLDTALSLAARGLDPDSRRKVWDALIRSRALVLEEMAARRHLASQSGDPALARLTADLAAASRRLANLTTRGPASDHPQTYLGELQRARREKEGAERSLAGKSATFDRARARDRVGFAEVSSALKPGSALVAYARYRRQPEGTPAYLAFVLGGGENAPSIVPLGTAAEIDALVARWANEMGRRGAAARSAEEAEEATRAAGTALRARIWDPLLPGLAKTARVFVVLEGALHSVNLAALPGDGAQYMIETGPLIHYLSSEREIAVDKRREDRGEGLLALGGVAFDEAAPYPGPDSTGGERRGASAATALARSRGEGPACPDFQSIRFAALPASAKEVDAIASLWERAEVAGKRVVRLTGARASEAAFKEKAAGRRVLHLATHGFFLGSRCFVTQGAERGVGGLALAAERRPPSASAESPLLLTGLALAGANHRDEAGPDQEDGILTAEEIAAMDLSGVEWAVLSACDTGVGPLAAGEGVLGLRRALEVAGVATVIMSLWPVDDEAALDWMRALYEKRLVEGLATAEAVRAAGLGLLKQRRETTGTAHPFYWAGFVAAGDWR